MTDWIVTFIEFGFLGIPLIAIAIGLLFVGKDTTNNDSLWRFGKNDPFKRLFYRGDGQVRESFRLTLVAIAVIAFLYLAAFAMLRLLGNRGV